MKSEGDSCRRRLDELPAFGVAYHAARGPDAQQEENEGEEVPRGEGATVSGNGYAGQLAFPTTLREA